MTWSTQRGVSSHAIESTVAALGDADLEEGLGRMSKLLSQAK